MKQQNQLNLPFNLKVSYTEELQLKLSLHHNLQNYRYNRHWLIIQGFQDNQGFFVAKKYFNYLQPGDLIKFIVNNSDLEWKQKNQKQTLNLLDFSLSCNQIKSKKSKQNKNGIQEKIQKIYQQNKKKQYIGLKFLTIVINQRDDFKVLNVILTKLQQINSSDIYVNLFVKQPLHNLKRKFDFLQKWVEIKKLLHYQKQLKCLFFFISKICLKNIHLKINCKSAQLHSKQDVVNKLGSQNSSQWKLSQNSLLNSIFFVKANKIYIYQIQFRNLGYQQQYTFQVSFVCQDAYGKKYNSVKSFKLKPTRKQFESIKTTDYVKQNQEKIRTIFDVNQSLSCENLQMFQKLDQLKVIGKKIQVQIKQCMKNKEQTDNQI